MARRRTRPAFAAVPESVFNDLRSAGVGASGSSWEILLYLTISGRQYGTVGLYALDAGLLAGLLRCAHEPVAAALDALAAAGMVEVDADAGVVYQPGAISADWPATDRNAMGYRRGFDRVPKSDLKLRWLLELHAFAVERGFHLSKSGEAAAWQLRGFEDFDLPAPPAERDTGATRSEQGSDGVGTPSRQGSNGVGTVRLPQDQDQDQDQDQGPDAETETIHQDQGAEKPGGDGASREESPRTKRSRGSALANLRIEELADITALRTRFDAGVVDGAWTDSENNWLEFVVAAQHALRMGDKNPCGMFSSNIRSGTRNGSAADEDKARALVKAHEERGIAAEAADGGQDEKPREQPAQEPRRAAGERRQLVPSVALLAELEHVAETLSKRPNTASETWARKKLGVELNNAREGSDDRKIVFALQDALQRDPRLALAAIEEFRSAAAAAGE